MNNVSTKECEMIQLFKNGNKDVFTDLIKPYYMQAYKIAYSILHQHHDAEDATQNAIIKVYKCLDQFRGTSSFKSWLIKIVRNHAVDIYRSNQRTTKIKDNFKETRSPDYIPTWQPTNVKEMKSDLTVLITSISPTYEEVIKLRFVDSLSYEEISSELMCSVGTVKSRISRGRKQIKTLMDGAA
jgi:RNA polymerase sigma-70 factor (ECF subfamily)